LHRDMRAQGMDPTRENVELFKQRLNEKNAYGTYVHPNSFASYLILFIPALIGDAYAGSARGSPAPDGKPAQGQRPSLALWQPRLLWVLIGLGVVALFFTRSRGAMLAAALVGVGMLVWLQWRWLLAHRLQAIVAAAVVVVGLVIASQAGLFTAGLDKPDTTEN